ncbi:hypothetical protein LXA43DRAFT_1069954 [Ganoderma leucocontextum]|nr:hypothetical protein LXA43DRAFT_1069954 [Ganoderma leucocontextum]
MASYKARLLGVEDDFLSSLSKGGDAIAAFEGRWEELLHDIDSAMDMSGFPSDIPPLAHAVAVRIAALADTSAALLVKCDDLTSQFVDEVDSLMSQLTLSDNSDQSSPTLPLLHMSGSPCKQDPISPSRKRRRSSMEESSVVPVKRHWNDTTTTRPWGSKRSSSSQHPSTSLESQSSVEPTSVSHPTKRKRRQSDGDLSALRNGAKRLRSGPRLHAVSDTYGLLQSPDTTLTRKTIQSKQALGLTAEALASSAEPVGPVAIYGTSFSSHTAPCFPHVEVADDLLVGKGWPGVAPNAMLDLLADPSIPCVTFPVPTLSDLFPSHMLTVPSSKESVCTDSTDDHFACSPSPFPTPSNPSTPLPAATLHLSVSDTLAGSTKCMGDGVYYSTGVEPMIHAFDPTEWSEGYQTPPPPFSDSGFSANGGVDWSSLLDTLNSVVASPAPPPYCFSPNIDLFSTDNSGLVASPKSVSMQPYSLLLSPESPDNQTNAYMANGQATNIKLLL